MKTDMFVKTLVLALATAAIWAQEPPAPPVPPPPPLAQLAPLAQTPPMPPVAPRAPFPVLAPVAPMPPEPWLAPMEPLPPDPPSALAGDAWELALLAPPALFMMQDAAREQERAQRDAQRSLQRATEAVSRSREKGDRYYSSAKQYLDRQEYDRAVDYFNRVIEDKGPRTDGALYWRAYAENKLGKRDAAVATLAELQKSYPNSRWISDAKALEVEVKGNVSPENTTDEDMKLLALNALINNDPERAVPILDKLLKSNSTPRVKERALFVLAQSRSPKGRDLIAQVARGTYNPDLQLKAVEYLAVYSGKENQQALTDIYKGTNDVYLKKKILNSFMICGCRDSVLAVAKGEQNADLRLEAIKQLGAMGGSAEAMQLYTPDASYDVKRAILQSLFIGGNADKIAEIARTDKDSKVRAEAIHQLGPMGRSKSGDALVQLYSKETDQQSRREILNGLFIQSNAPAIIEIARKETDPNLKREAVQKLSLMHSKEATDFLVELLNK